MRPSNDPQKAGIGDRTILCVVYDQFHLAADALQSRLDLEFQNVAGARRSPRRQRRLYRLRLEQIVKPLLIHSDLDVLGFDVDPVDESQEDGSDYVWSERGKLL